MKKWVCLSSYEYSQTICYHVSGQVFNPSMLTLDSGEPVQILEGFCQARAVNNTFAGVVWSAVDQDGVLHHLPHLQGVPDCGEYIQGDQLLYAFITGNILFQYCMLYVCNMFAIKLENKQFEIKSYQIEYQIIKKRHVTG